MTREIVFVLEPDAGRVTVESSQAARSVVKEMTRDLGQGSALNCARPSAVFEKRTADKKTEISSSDSENTGLHLFRLYHDSTVDGPGRRCVVQVAGCSIRCAGCYVPETHERANGKLVSVDEIICEIDERRVSHDGVTILGGEPFDQADSLEILVAKLKASDYHLCVYTGYTLESLIARSSKSVNRVLETVDLLVDGAFDRNLTRNAGEYRGSSNQRLIYYPILRNTNEQRTNQFADDRRIE
jgi:anaerobic ribonucleoside-triphosphate reductase activating protein